LILVFEKLEPPGLYLLEKKFCSLIYSRNQIIEKYQFLRYVLRCSFFSIYNLISMKKIQFLQLLLSSMFDNYTFQNSKIYHSISADRAHGYYTATVFYLTIKKKLW